MGVLRSPELDAFGPYSGAREQKVQRPECIDDQNCSAYCRLGPSTGGLGSDMFL